MGERMRVEAREPILDRMPLAYNLAWRATSARPPSARRSAHVSERFAGRAIPSTHTHTHTRYPTRPKDIENLETSGRWECGRSHPNGAGCARACVCVLNGRESSPQPEPLECYTTRRMPTRLQKLVALLANGPSEAARLAAARQLGELQRAHPAQLHVLLQHILRHLFASEWPTRRAAAAALQAVAEAADAWSPEQPEEPDEVAEAAARAEAEGAWLSFRSFEMASVLAHGRPLLASGEVV